MSADDGPEELEGGLGESTPHIQLESDVEIALEGDVRRIIEHVLRTEASALADPHRLDRDDAAVVRLLAMLLTAQEHGHDVESSLRRLATGAEPGRDGWRGQ